MKTPNFFLVLLFFLLSSGIIFPQALQSVMSMQGATNVYDIATDAVGNYYITGFFYGNLNIAGNPVLTSAGMSDVFVGKCSNTGSIIWLSRAGGHSFDVGYSIAADPAGNVYVSGTFTDTMYFGNTQLIASGGSGIDIFTAKYDNSGNLLWAKRFGGPVAEYTRAITCDAYGNTYQVGDFYDSTYIGSTTLISYGQYDVLIFKLDTNGNVVWAKQAGGERSDEGYDIVADGVGNSYLTGNFMMTASFGTKQLVSDYNGSAFFVKYDNTGNCVWANQSSIPSSASASGIAIDPAGNVYATGYFFETLTLGSLSLTNQGGSDLYLTKLNSAGEFVWATGAGGTGTFDTFFAGSVVADEHGNSFVGGYFEGDVVIGGSHLISYGITDPYAVKFDTNGNPSWSVKGSGLYIDDCNTIAIFGDNQIFIGGSYGEHFSFGGPELPYWGCYVAKYTFTTGVNDNPQNPSEYSLEQNYPNPFNPTTVISCQVPTREQVSLKVFDLLGNEVADVVNSILEPGMHNFEFRAYDYNLSSGVYYYRLVAGDFTSARKMILIK